METGNFTHAFIQKLFDLQNFNAIRQKHMNSHNDYDAGSTIVQLTEFIKNIVGWEDVLVKGLDKKIWYETMTHNKKTYLTYNVEMLDETPPLQKTRLQ